MRMDWLFGWLLEQLTKPGFESNPNSPHLNTLPLAGVNLSKT